MERKNTYTYEIDGKLYVNLTNECNNNCEFCVRRTDNTRKGYDGYDLWLEKEPTAEQVIAQIGDPKNYPEIVFCGYGEPTLRLDTLLEIARYVKEKGGKVRINTNGLANLYYGKNVVPSMKGLVDVVSISLNQSNARAYDAICHSRYGEAAVEGMLEFARECVKVLPKVILSIVDVIGEEEIEKCRQIAQEVGATLRVRAFIE